MKLFVHECPECKALLQFGKRMDITCPVCGAAKITVTTQEALD